MLRKTRSLLILSLAAAILTHGAAAVSAQPVDDPFFHYTGTAPLEGFAPGSVLGVRTVPYHLLNVATPLDAVQILYRSTDAQGRPSANVTSVLRPPNAQPDKVISYQSAYDSLNPDDGPSRAIAGNTPLLSLTPSGRNAPRYPAKARSSPRSWLSVIPSFSPTPRALPRTSQPAPSTE